MWLASIGDGLGQALPISQILHDDEIQRRDRFVRLADQQRFVQSRVWLRILLGGYLQAKPEEISFGYGPYGKPFLSGDARGSIFFNISHSGDFIVLAFHAACEVGVDIELATELPEIAGVAREIFTADQLKRWSALSPDRRQYSFFEQWTKREASLKALGIGFGATPPEQSETQISTRRLELPPGYSGTVAWQHG